MGNYQKGICNTWSELKTHLTDLGFIISGNKMRWGQDGQGNDSSTWTSYWLLNNTKQTINFYSSGEVFPNATTIAEKHTVFHTPLVHMTNDTSYDGDDTIYNDKTKAGFIFIELLDHGCILYLTPILADNTTSDKLYMSCFIDKQQMLVNGEIIKNNGIIVCTPQEEDGYYRYSWRHDAGYETTDCPDGLYPFDSSNSSHDRNKLGFFRWDIDNMHGFISRGTELPQAELIDAQMSVSMVMSYLVTGYWSSNIYYMAVGAVPADGAGLIFRINNQSYLIITDNTKFRCPIFKLPIEKTQQNPPTSTEAYSEYKMYAVGDYCIYDGLLYRCIREIRQVGPFDDTYWTATTVYDEKYGNV